MRRTSEAWLVADLNTQGSVYERRLATRPEIGLTLGYPFPELYQRL